MERRLAAILAADVVGYTHLMGSDEAGTLRRYTELRERVLGPLISDHRGRVVKLLGDGLLVEFASLVDAVGCAVAWQSAAAQHEAGRDEASRLSFRIGINLGDVIVEGDDIHGDGVNVAARLEGLAEPGGICLSGDAYRQVRGKIEAAFEDLGERHLKNVAETVRVYRIPSAESGAVSAKHPGEPLPLPDKPSIAVLPFLNLSGDPEQEYFANGITEDITTVLSRFRSLFVIARTSSFAYKGRSVDVRDVARDLGVQYVVEGSVRKSGNRVRVTAQLIEAESGSHLWAERFDRDLTDIFQVQDEITHAIAVALQVQLTEGEIARVLAEGTRNLAAWEAVNSGIRFMEDHSKANNAQAQRLFTEALQHDPNYLQAKAFLAFTYWMDKRFAFVPDPDHALEKAKELMQEIEAAGGRSATSEQVKALIAQIEGRHDDALAAARGAVELGPNDPWALLVFGEIHMYCGRPRAALHSLRTAMRLSPYSPATFVYYLAYTYMWLSEHDKAVAAGEDYAGRLPNEPLAYPLLACVYAFAGRENDARTAINTLRTKFPTFTVETYAPTQYYRDPEQLNRLIDVLRRVGLPDRSND